MVEFHRKLIKPHIENLRYKLKDVAETSEHQHEAFLRRYELGIESCNEFLRGESCFTDLVRTLCHEQLIEYVISFKHLFPPNFRAFLEWYDRTGRVTWVCIPKRYIKLLVTCDENCMMEERLQNSFAPQIRTDYV